MPPIIDKSKCTCCGLCVEICDADVFYGSKATETPVVCYPDECWHESNCVKVCPVEGAIRLRMPLPMMLSYK